MNSNSYIGPTEFSRRRQKDGVALVITLLMLSVITFLAVAFLAMSRRNQSAINASLDLTTARAMSEAAQARAQAEIMAQILASGDPLQYDYMVSQNFINPAGFYAKYKDSLNTTNVNYDNLANTTTLLNNTSLQEDWVQNIANLYYDPRPPVFVNISTNPAVPLYDFRFYVDINRNGRFETNGYQTTLTNERLNSFGPSAVLNGEPEFIGVLKNPLFHHSSSNQFLGRYAYLVLPVGKTLDLNYIHNFLKGSLESNQMGQLNNTSTENDGFARDQGIGSWELNLGGLLDAVSPWAYENNHANYGPAGLSFFSPYQYSPPDLSNLANTGLANHGSAFNDAEAILHFRYSPETYALNTLSSAYPTNYLDFEDNLIDIYCANASLVPPFDYYGSTNYPIAKGAYNTLVKTPWAGSYQANMFFDVQDLFDPAKTSFNFTNRMILASQRTNTYDRYTFQRLISCIGMGSSPEYGVWVYDNFGSNTLRTKVNINYDNTAQITNANAPYAPMPTNLIPWKPAAFFNNAADLLLRSQPHIYPIYASNLVIGFSTNFFGVTNIPIYSASNPGIKYDAGVHRLLQLAANIYDATLTNTYDSIKSGLPPLRHPTIFRPLFNTFGSRGSNAVLYITGYAQVLDDGSAFSQMLLPYQDMSNVVNGTFHTNWNVAGIPWVVAADSGLPGFYHYTSGTQVLLTRKLLFRRQIVAGIVKTNLPPESTNQFFCMAITNSIGMDGWNPYPTAFSGMHRLYSYYSNYVTIELTNEYNFGTNIIVAASNYLTASTTPLGTWKAGGGPAKSSAGILSLFNYSNIVTLPESYYSESNHSFLSIIVTNGNISTGSFRTGDVPQKSWPVYNWTINVSNHVVYGLFDGPPGRGTLLDFVNLGPFGATLSITNIINQPGLNQVGMNSGTPPGTYWAAGAATSLPGSAMSSGVLAQINAGEEVPNTTFAADLIGSGVTSPNATFSCPFEPGWVIQQPTNWVANDPLVHYTVEDLTWNGDTIVVQKAFAANGTLPTAMPSTLGLVSTRYSPWGSDDTFRTNMLLKDPLITRASDWQFPTNKFPSVGWIGRVHRGTPWQTVFLKSDNTGSYALWSNWANPFWISGQGANTSYPTNDWPLVDVFTTSPNDNAATGLLSVNQTNDPAWAAVFAGVIALTNINGGVQIMPNNSYGNLSNFTNLMDGPLGINAQRANYPNGIFHKVGYILGAPALTVSSPFLAGPISQMSDEVIERIPQQTLSLLKVGEPQFVIFAWGQALKPKGPPYLGLGANGNTYTNYEITGEVLTRTACHLVYTNGLKMVIDNYNVESGN